jgi:hypothetical protein
MLNVEWMAADASLAERSHIQHSTFRSSERHLDRLHRRLATEAICATRIVIAVMAYPEKRMLNGWRPMVRWPSAATFNIQH